MGKKNGKWEGGKARASFAATHPALAAEGNPHATGRSPGNTSSPQMKRRSQRQQAEQKEKDAQQKEKDELALRNKALQKKRKRDAQKKVKTAKATEALKQAVKISEEQKGAPSA